MTPDEIEKLQTDNAELRTKFAAVSSTLGSLERAVLNLQEAFGRTSVLTRDHVTGRLFTEREVTALLKHEREHAERITAAKGK